MTSVELRQKAFGILQTMQGILAKADTEKRELSGEEITAWRAAKADYDRAVEQIEIVEATERINAENARSLGTQVGAQGGRGAGEEKREVRSSTEYRRALALASQFGRERLSSGDRATLETGFEEQAGYRGRFWDWAREGIEGLSNEQRSELRSGHVLPTKEMRAMSAGIATAGGYLIPDEDQLGIVTAMKLFGGMLPVSQVIETTTGADIPIPTADDTANMGEQVGENQAVSEQDAAVGAKSFPTYLFSTKMIRASIVLMQDAPGWFENWLRDRMAERLARILNTKWTSGSGAATIEGFLAKATLGKTTAGATAITRAELIALEHSVDPLYRVGARYMMADGVLGYLKTLESQNQPVFPGLRATDGANLNGYPYSINQDMDGTVATTKKTVAFGNFENYLIRNVGNMVVSRLVERYAEYGQVAFLGFSRHGGLLLDTGSPIKYLQQA